MVLKLGHFDKWSLYTLKILKCGAAEGWIRLIGLTALKIKKHV